MRRRRMAVINTGRVLSRHGPIIVPSELSLEEIRSDMHDFITRYKQSFVAGSEFDFWFEGDDDIYDELYGHLKRSSGKTKSR